MPILFGKYEAGHGTSEGTLGDIIAKIRQQSGLSNLIPRTFNVRLEAPVDVVHTFSVQLQREPPEEYYFEPCDVGGLRCLVMRTSRENYHRDLLEIMSEKMLHEHLSVGHGSAVSVTFHSTQSAEPPNVG